MAPSGDGATAERIRGVVAAQGEGLASLCFRTGDIAKMHRRLDRLALKPETVAEVESRELASIERALVRVKNGTYGECEGCGQKIPVARLSALPYATSCIECQRAAESGNGAGGGAGDKQGPDVPPLARPPWAPSAVSSGGAPAAEPPFASPPGPRRHHAVEGEVGFAAAVRPPAR